MQHRSVTSKYTVRAGGGGLGGGGSQSKMLFSTLVSWSLAYQRDKQQVSLGRSVTGTAVCRRYTVLSSTGEQITELYRPRQSVSKNYHFKSCRGQKTPACVHHCWTLDHNPDWNVVKANNHLHLSGNHLAGRRMSRICLVSVSKWSFFAHFLFEGWWNPATHFCSLSGRDIIVNLHLVSPVLSYSERTGILLDPPTNLSTPLFLHPQLNFAHLPLPSPTSSASPKIQIRVRSHDCVLQWSLFVSNDITGPEEEARLEKATVGCHDDNIIYPVVGRI